MKEVIIESVINKSKREREWVVIRKKRMIALFRDKSGRKKGILDQDSFQFICFSYNDIYCATCCLIWLILDSGTKTIDRSQKFMLDN